MGKAEKKSDTILLRYYAVIDEYFSNNFDGAAAYMHVYQNCKKKSAAAANFARLQQVEEVRQYIASKQEEARSFVSMDAQGVIHELKCWLESDITTTIGLTPDEMKGLPPEFRRLIQSYKIVENNKFDKEGNLASITRTISIQLVSKERALDMLNRHIGFYGIDSSEGTKSININVLNDKHKGLITDILGGAKNG